MRGKILITGARGKVGRVLIKRLQEKGEEFIAGVSDESKVEELEKLGIETVVINYSKPETLIKAMREVDRVFLLLPLNSKMQEWGINAIRAAKEARVRYILKLSVLDADTSESIYELGRVHGVVDKALEESGIHYSIIKPNAFMQNYETYHCSVIKNSNALYLPQGDGKLSLIDVRDVATAAAEILVHPMEHDSKSYPLTGSEALSNFEVVDAISRVIGREIKYYPVEDKDAIAGLKQMGMDDWSINVLMSLNKKIKEGNTAQISNSVKEITRRDPITFGQYVKESKGCWA